MKLYYTKRSPYARKVRIAALEKGLELDLRAEDLTSKSAELYKLNPVGRIPVLECADGMVLCDSSAICTYLDELSREPLLVPQEGITRWRVLNLDAVAKNLTDVTVSVFYEKLIHPEDFHPKFVAKKEAEIVQGLEYFNERVEELRELSLAAISVACAIGYIEFRLSHLWPQKSCQSLLQWYDEISQRESLQNTLPVA